METKDTAPSASGGILALLKTVPMALPVGWRYLRTHGLRATWKAVNSREVHPLVQFCKYGLCGVAAVTVQVAFAYLFMIWFPASKASGLPDEQRAWNAFTSNLLAFPLSNLVAYVTNALWVFNGGRHSRWVEFLLFTGIALVSFLAGILGGPFLIKHFGISHHLAEGGFVITSALVNFLCRKFLVFKS